MYLTFESLSISISAVEFIKQFSKKYIPSIAISSTVILFCVSVPVLSEHITETEPIVSQASFFVTNAFILAIFCIVIARVIFIIVGNPSGTAATIKAIHTVNAVFIGSIDSKNSTGLEVFICRVFAITICPTIYMNNKPAIALDTFAILLPRSPSLICRGVSSCSTFKFCAISPI